MSVSLYERDRYIQEIFFVSHPARSSLQPPKLYAYGTRQFPSFLLSVFLDTCSSRLLSSALTCGVRIS